MTIQLLSYRWPQYNIITSFYDYLSSMNKPMIVVLNKIDLVSASYIDSWMNWFKVAYPSVSILPYSSTFIPYHTLATDALDNTYSSSLLKMIKYSLITDKKNINNVNNNNFKNSPSYENISFESSHLNKSIEIKDEKEQEVLENLNIKNINNFQDNLSDNEDNTFEEESVGIINNNNLDDSDNSENSDEIKDKNLKVKDEIVNNAIFINNKRKTKKKKNDRDDRVKYYTKRELRQLKLNNTSKIVPQKAHVISEFSTIGMILIY